MMRAAITFVVFVWSVVACGGAVSPLSDAPDRADRPDAGAASGDSRPLALDPTVFDCRVDADCLAIPAGGCCPDGTKVAVNVNRVGDYQNAVKCTAMDPPPCVPPDVTDRRVAECTWRSSGHGTCEMVAVGEIACGGFTANPHECPRGFVCQEPGNDATGKCIEPPRDCRNDGCSVYDEYCAECAGVFACRSVHAPAC